MVQWFQTYWGRSTNSVCIGNSPIPSCNEWNLCLQDGPSWHKLLHCDHVRAWLYEIQDFARNGCGSLGNSSWSIVFSNYGPDDILSFLEFSQMWPWCLPFLITYSRIERKSNVYSMKPRLATISFKRCPHVQQTVPSLQYDKNSLHCVLGSVSNNSNSSTLPTSWIICFVVVPNGL